MVVNVIIISLAKCKTQTLNHTIKSGPMVVAHSFANSAHIDQPTDVRLLVCMLILIVHVIIFSLSHVCTDTWLLFSLSSTVERK